MGSVSNKFTIAITGVKTSFEKPIVVENNPKREEKPWSIPQHICHISRDAWSYIQKVISDKLGNGNDGVEQ